MGSLSRDLPQFSSTPYIGTLRTPQTIRLAPVESLCPSRVWVNYSASASLQRGGTMGRGCACVRKTRVLKVPLVSLFCCPNEPNSQSHCLGSRFQEDYVAAFGAGAVWEKGLAEWLAG